MDPSARPWRVLEEPEDLPSSSVRGDDAGPGARTRWLPLAAFGVAGVLGIAALVLTIGGASPAIDVSGSAAFEASDRARGGPSAVTAGLLLIDVHGAVAHPGLVRLISGS